MVEPLTLWNNSALRKYYRALKVEFIICSLFTVLSASIIRVWITGMTFGVFGLLAFSLLLELDRTAFLLKHREAMKCTSSE